MKIPKLPAYVKDSVKSGYIKNRVKLLNFTMKGRHKIFTYRVTKGMGKGKEFSTNLNLINI